MSSNQVVVHELGIESLCEGCKNRIEAVQVWRVYCQSCTQEKFIQSWSGIEDNLSHREASHCPLLNELDSTLANFRDQFLLFSSPILTVDRPDITQAHLNGMPWELQELLWKFIRCPTSNISQFSRINVKRTIYVGRLP